jgi:membrane associated rhomboid family serine protease
MMKRASFSRRFAGFRSVGLAFTIFTLLNLAVFFLISLWPGLLDFLWLSADHPWGIVTSNFVQAELPHLASNLEGFTFAAGFFVIVCLVLKVEDRRRWSRIFLWLVFLSGIVGSAIEYPVLIKSQDFSWGASGIVYGGLGVLLAACIRSLPAHMQLFAKEHRRARKRRKRRVFKFDRKSLRTFPSLMSFALLLSFLVLIFTDPANFLSVAPGVDVLAHGLGFLLGFLPAMVLFRPTFRHTRRSKN